jgi:hypothetical protein
MTRWRALPWIAWVVLILILDAVVPSLRRWLTTFRRKEST